MQEDVGVGRIERGFACTGYRLGGHTEMDDLGPSFQWGIILLRSFSVKEESHAYAWYLMNCDPILRFPVVEILGASKFIFTQRKAMRFVAGDQAFGFESLERFPIKRHSSGRLREASRVAFLDNWYCAIYEEK